MKIGLCYSSQMIVDKIKSLHQCQTLWVNLASGTRAIWWGANFTFMEE